MLVTARCSNCAHEFQVDSGYLGTQRRCPKCEVLFAFDEGVNAPAPAAEAPVDAGAVAASAPTAVPASTSRGRANVGALPRDGDERLGCGACLRIFVPADIFLDRDTVPCTFCATQVTRAEDRRLFDLLQQTRDTATEGDGYCLPWYVFYLLRNRCGRGLSARVGTGGPRTVRRWPRRSGRRATARLPPPPSWT